LPIDIYFRSNRQVGSLPAQIIIAHRYPIPNFTTSQPGAIAGHLFTIFSAPVPAMDAEGAELHFNGKSLIGLWKFLVLTSRLTSDPARIRPSQAFVFQKTATGGSVMNPSNEGIKQSSPRQGSADPEMLSTADFSPLC
jgi:hypothetical protein